MYRANIAAETPRLSRQSARDESSESSSIALAESHFAIASRNELIIWISFVLNDSKEDEVLIWIRDNKGSGTPWLLLKCLMEGDSCSLITQKQLFDFVRGGQRDGSGQQMFALANIASEHGFADHPHVEARIVADDLPVVGRIAIDECDCETELVCIEIAGTP